MRRALALAAKGLGSTAPNPAVGAVIVKAGEIIGEGYHHSAGEAHAEVLALRAAGETASGADLYVTLEPCCHHGRTPPCTEAILAAGIKRVFYACSDPDERVAGGGHRALIEGGCEVFRGPLTESAVRLNRAYFKHKTTGLPHVTLKMAMTLDGRVAMDSGESEWITGPEAREVVQRMRSEVQVIMVGAGTARADDPSLTTRLAGDAHRADALIVDSTARTPLTARALQRDDGTACLVACCEGAEAENIRALAANRAEVLCVGEKCGRVDLRDLMRRLGERDVMSVLCEGGPILAGGLMQENLVDEIVFFVAPKLLGQGPGPVVDLGISALAEAAEVEIVETRRVGPDMIIRGRVCSQG
jgi:diaminohydroxyphosphoribosylaminopyrimidine deaminase / 5-amino-6-(5-phosphoribosylamino)uracil reductase